MNTIEKCAEVMKSRHWTQRELAKELGVLEQNMTHVMKGRRELPAHALAKLERLRGTDDRAIVDMIIKQAACVALAVVLLLMPARENVAYASEAYTAAIDNNTNSRVFWSRVLSRLAALFQKLTRSLRSWGMLIPA